MLKKDFTSEKEQLNRLAAESDKLSTDTERYWLLIDDYNKILDNMIDQGFDDFLPEDVLPIPPDLISDRYFALSQKLRRQNRPSFNDFLRDHCGNICLVKVNKIAFWRAEISVSLIKEYVGSFPSEFTTGYLTPWGAAQWFEEGERTVLVFNRKTNGLSGYCSRMPLLTLNETDYLISYLGEEVSFDGYDVIPYGNYGDRKLIRLDQFESRLNNYKSKI